MKRVAIVAALCLLAFVCVLCGCSGPSGPGAPGMATTAKKPEPPPPDPPPSTSSKIAFQRYMGTKGRERGTWQIFSINTDGTGEQKLTSGTSINQKPSWGPDGRIAFTSNRDGQRRLYTMDSDGSNQEALTSPPAGNPGDNAPDVCPCDAGKVAFVRNREGTASYSDIWIVADGTETQLTTGPLRDEWPSFSPNGTFVVFNRKDTEGEAGQLCVVHAAGGTPWVLVEGTYPEWSPDGSSIVYYSQADAWTIAVNETTGEATGAPVPVTDDDTAVREYGPTWAPLGDFIAYWTGSYEIAIRELGAGATALTEGEFPDWSPDVF